MGCLLSIGIKSKKPFVLKEQLISIYFLKKGTNGKQSARNTIYPEHCMYYVFKNAWDSVRMDYGTIILNGVSLDQSA